MPLAALLDTNVWVSAFLKPNGPPGQVVAAWGDDEFSAVTSLSQLSEIAEVLSRPRLVLRFRYPRRDAEAFVRLIGARATVVQTLGELQICRDPDDERIVEAAIGGKANTWLPETMIFKRDLDLVKLARRNRIRVVSVRQFLRRLARQAKR